jgi:hypothetical protein
VLVLKELLGSKPHIILSGAIGVGWAALLLDAYDSVSRDRALRAGLVDWLHGHSIRAARFWEWRKPLSVIPEGPRPPGQ